ncbi:MAG: AAA family ATPase [Verrucomicrobia bacterium]|nr:AAA family ATPase [Verrucomicrobiota bacterium]
MDLLAHWGLAERPFEPTWDTRFFFQGREYDEALSRLDFLASEQTMLLGLLTGEVGCGKTVTRAVFAEQLADQPEFQVVTLENSSFSFNELLGLLLRELEPDAAGTARTKYSRYERFHEVMERLAQDRRHLVLLFDEAQEMSPATLNELKLLTNLNRAGQGRLTVILVGQPELRERVARLPAIDQRIGLRFHLHPLSREETGDYLRHRLRVAGRLTGELFAPEAVESAFQNSQGVPRELNRIAKLALEFAWVNEYPEVTSAAINAVARDLNRHQRLPKA